MNVNSNNNINFKGVLVENCSKDQAINELIKSGHSKAKTFDYIEKGDSVEISYNRDKIREEVTKMPAIKDPNHEIWGVESVSDMLSKTFDATIYSFFNSLGYKSKLTGESSEIPKYMIDTIANINK
ncbi:MAG: hypothetical protein M0C28_17900 [Candidatus Moduliflexus flocculans]|nr:hypothetical protein [Candidatus Moduliflexus flocculans]